MQWWASCQTVVYHTGPNVAYTTAIRGMLTHAQYVLCFCHFWWTVPTTLCLRYWHSYLSTMVNSFTLGTQNGTVKTKTLCYMRGYISRDSIGHSFHLSSNSTKEHYIPRKYSGCYISQRLPISTRGAWLQCLCGAYLPWLFSIMHYLISPTYILVQHSSSCKVCAKWIDKAHSFRQPHKSWIGETVHNNVMLNCEGLLALQKCSPCASNDCDAVGSKAKKHWGGKLQIHNRLRRTDTPRRISGTSNK